MSDLEARVRTVLLEDASRVPLVGQMPEHVRFRVRRRRAMTVVTASLAASLLIAGSVFAVRSFDRSGVMPAPPAPASPISEDWMLEDRLGASQVYATRTWEDPRDASVAGVDMTRLKFSGNRSPDWYLELAELPKERTTAEVLSYGLVLDTTRDGVPDYLVGIEDYPTPPGDVLAGDQDSPRHTRRVWVTDLATGETDEQIGPPYGFPIEFVFPRERDGTDARMVFTFIPGSEPDDMVRRSVRIYAWASLTRDGEVVARDVAPDDGWMTVPARR
jgi:hypothetical protein